MHSTSTTTPTMPDHCVPDQQAVDVLLIEDNPADRMLVEQYLKHGKQRYRVTACPTLEAGAEALRRSRWGVVLTDMNLPDGSGLQTLEKLQGFASRVPIIVLTTLDDDEFALVALRRFAQDYLPKGAANPETLERAIRNAMQRHEKRGEIQALVAKLGSARHLVRKNRRLKRLYRTARRFVSDVSHEFRTPLTVIKEYVSLLGEGIAGEVSPEQIRMLNIVGVRADDLNTMVDDMLDVSRLEAGVLGASRTCCQVKDIIAHVLPSLERKASVKGIHFEVRLPEDLPEVYCDSEKAGRVIINLVNNAIKFCGEPGHVRLWAGIDPQDHDVLVGVTDNGQGIDEASQQVIFGQFSQLGNQTRGSTKGFGLGLSIAKELAELNLGRIGLDSQPGQGSTFHFTLPVAQPREVLRRYATRLQTHAKGRPYVTVVTARTRGPVDPESLEDAEMLLNYLLCRNDLLWRGPAGLWVLILSMPRRNFPRFLARAEQALFQANRARLHGPLPEIDVQAVGEWRVAKEKDALVNAVCHLFESDLPTDNSDTLRKDHDGHVMHLESVIG